MTKEEKQEEIYNFDMDNPEPKKHIWVDRGLIMSCEGADHPNHRHFKFKKESL